MGPPPKGSYVSKILSFENIYYICIWGFPKNRGPLLGSPDNKSPTIFGVHIRAPDFWNPPYVQLLYMYIERPVLVKFLKFGSLPDPRARDFNPKLAVRAVLFVVRHLFAQLGQGQ